MTDTLVKKRSKIKAEYAEPLPLERRLQERVEQEGARSGPHYHVTRSPWPHEHGKGKMIIKSFATEADARSYLARYPTSVQTAFKIPTLDSVEFRGMTTERQQVVVDRTWRASMRRCTDEPCTRGSWESD